MRQIIRANKLAGQAASPPHRSRWSVGPQPRQRRTHQGRCGIQRPSGYVVFGPSRRRRLRPSLQESPNWPRLSVQRSDLGKIKAKAPHAAQHHSGRPGPTQACALMGLRRSGPGWCCCPGDRPCIPGRLMCRSKHVQDFRAQGIDGCGSAVETAQRFRRTFMGAHMENGRTPPRQGFSLLGRRQNSHEACAANCLTARCFPAGVSQGTMGRLASAPVEGPVHGRDAFIRSYRLRPTYPAPYYHTRAPTRRRRTSGRVGW